MAQVTITLDDAKLNEFRMGFLAFCPIPEDDNGEPAMNFQQWIKTYLRNELLSTYRAGKTKLASETVSVDTDMIT